MSYVIFVFGPIPSFQIPFISVLRGSVRVVVVGGLCSRGAGGDGFKFKSPALSLLLFRTLVIALWIRPPCFAVACSVLFGLRLPAHKPSFVETSSKEGFSACKTGPNKTQQALYVDAVLALVKGTGLAICRVATHAQAVSTLRGGRDLHVLQYEPVARLDAEREP